MNSPFNESQAQLLNQLLGDLTGTQRVWLTGYLSAMLATEEGAPTQTGALQAVQNQQPKQEITVLYGTQTGNAQELAETFTSQLVEKDLQVTAVAMNDFKPKDLKKLTHVLVIISTHGEGDPPDNAIAFYEFLNGKRAPKLDGLQFSVLSLGDSSYEQFCSTGKEIDARLEELGATRIADRVDCDLDFDEPAAEWLTSVTPVLEETNAQSATINTGQTQATSNVTSLYSRTNPYEAEVLENINLNGRGSNKETRHLELLIEDANLKFEPGDSIGIYAENTATIVDALIDELNWEADEALTIKEQAYTVKEALTHYYEITVLTKPLLEKLNTTFTSEKLTAFLEADNAAALKAYIADHDLLDVIRDFELQEATVDTLTSLLRKMPARLYSVASSYLANPDEVHVTIGVVRYEAGEREREGVCSVQCAERINVGDSLKIYVHRNQNFRLPEDPAVPIIMIGPGTGIAPFRSFIEEREEIEAPGKSWLFFGDQHYVTDFLYQVEWQQWLKKGVLTKLDLAFSRDTDEKVYVQHKLLKQQKEVFAWLEEGAVVYVCGDEKQMAKDVQDTLIHIIKEEGNLSDDDAQAYLATMQQNKRYQRDVY